MIFYRPDFYICLLLAFVTGYALGRSVRWRF